MVKSDDEVVARGSGGACCRSEVRRRLDGCAVEAESGGGGDWIGENSGGIGFGDGDPEEDAAAAGRGTNVLDFRVGLGSGLLYILECR